MKKNLFSMLGILSLSCFLLDACTPDIPSENNPRYIDGLQFNPDYFQNSTELTSISPESSPCLPGQGNCIMILPSSPSLSQDMSVAFSAFKRYFNNKDLVGFFYKVKNWDKLFPGLNQDSTMVKGLMNGTYKMQIAKDNKAVVIYKGLSPGTGNIARAYWYDRMYCK